VEGLVAGDVIVDYPYTDLSQTKRRPALVVHVIPNMPNLILCQITSQFKTDPDAVTLTAADFA
jgi:mRNA interferase MazF